MVNPVGSVKDADDWQVSGVTVGDGAAIGGGCTLLPGMRVDQWALLGAGSVVTRSVPDHALVYGNPAGRRLCRSHRSPARVERLPDGRLRYTLEDGREIIYEPR